MDKITVQRRSTHYQECYVMRESPSKAVSPSGNIRNATAGFCSLSKSMTPPLHTQIIPVNRPENPKKLLPKIRHCWQYFPPPQISTNTAASQLHKLETKTVELKNDESVRKSRSQSPAVVIRAAANRVISHRESTRDKLTQCSLHTPQREKPRRESSILEFHFPVQCMYQ